MHRRNSPAGLSGTRECDVILLAKERQLRADNRGRPTIKKQKQQLPTTTRLDEETLLRSEICLGADTSAASTLWSPTRPAALVAVLR